jgi:hypothetical protein
MPVEVTINGRETSPEESKNYEEFYLVGYNAMYVELFSTSKKKIGHESRRGPNQE